MNFWDGKLFADIVTVVFSGIGIGCFLALGLMRLSDWLEDRRARKYEKTQDPELSKYRREGKL